MTTKQRLRQQLRARRARVSPAEHDSASRAVADAVVPMLEPFHVIAGFASFENEIDLTDAYRMLLQEQRQLLFPRVTGPGKMDFVPVNDLGALEPGAFGIPEPWGAPADPAEIEVFLVPGLAFDRSGNRLGFGGGYYDRALGDLRATEEKIPLAVGIGYSWQVLDLDLPADPWDVRLDFVVTDGGTIAPDSGREPQEAPQ